MLQRTSDDAPGREGLRAGLKIVLGSLAIFAIAFTLQRLLVPDVMPIAWADAPQALWAVELAFLLRAIENVAIFVVLVLAVVSGAQWAARRLGLGTPAIRR
jgi:hypothetical protein